MEEIYPSPDKPYDWSARFIPGLPSKRPRYNRNIVIKPFEKEDMCFQPLKTQTVFKPQEVRPWKRYIQPEGQPYYYLAKDWPRYFSYLVELDLTDQVTLHEVECFIIWFEEEAAGVFPNIPFEKNFEVVFETSNEGRETNDGSEGKGGSSDRLWSYYVVDVEERKVFWIHEFTISRKDLIRAGIGKEEHLQHLFGSEYWKHVRDFPNHHSISQDAVNKLLGILTCYFIDDALEIGDGQVTPFNAQDLRESLNAIRKLKDVKDDTRPGYLSYCIATLMLVVGSFLSWSPVIVGAQILKSDNVETERFLNFHGFHGARLDAHQSVRGHQDRTPRTWLARLMLPVLLYQPESTLRRFEKMYTDRLICLHDWIELQERLERDSNSFIIFATVLLAVDVSLLTVPSVVGAVTDNSLPANRTTLTTLTAQLSMITCLGSIVIGLLHGRQERVNTRDKANSYTSDSKALKYLNGDSINHSVRDSASQFRLETLAIQYSLPFGLLGWGVVLFAIAVLTSCFDASFTVVRIIARRSVYAAVCLIVASLVIWTIVVGLIIDSSLPFASERDQKGPNSNHGSELSWYKRPFACLSRYKHHRDASDLPLHSPASSGAD